MDAKSKREILKEFNIFPEKVVSSMQHIKDEDMDKSISHCLKLLRESFDIEILELAHQSKISYQDIVDLENGELKFPPVDFLESLTKGMDFPIGLFLLMCEVNSYSMFYKENVFKNKDTLTSYLEKIINNKK